MLRIVDLDSRNNGIGTLNLYLELIFQLIDIHASRHFLPYPTVNRLNSLRSSVFETLIFTYKYFNHASNLVQHIKLYISQ